MSSSYRPIAKNGLGSGTTHLSPLIMLAPTVAVGQSQLLYPNPKTRSKMERGRPLSASRVGKRHKPVLVGNRFFQAPFPLLWQRAEQTQALTEENGGDGQAEFVGQT